MLRGVRDPELGGDIVELGMFRGADVTEDGDVSVQVALTIAGCPLRGQIEREVKSKVSGLPGVRNVSVQTVEMDQAERAELMSLVRRRAHDSPDPTEIPATARVVAIASGKGGVGKSTVTVNIAALLAERGFTVGLLDADIWGFSVPRMLGMSGRLTGSDSMIEPQSRQIGDGLLKVVSMGFLVDVEEQALMWRGLILSRAVEQFLKDVRWGDLDYLLVDLPPGTGDVQMALSRLLPQSEMIVVTTPQVAAQVVAVRVANMATRSYLKVAGVIENMSAFVCDHGEEYAIFGSGGGTRLAEQLGVPLIGEVPLDSRVIEGGDSGEPASIAAPDSPGGAAFAKITDRMVSEIAPPIAMESCTARIFEAVRQSESDAL